MNKRRRKINLVDSEVEEEDDFNLLPSVRLNHQNDPRIFGKLKYNFSSKKLKKNSGELPLYVGNIIKKFYKKGKKNDKNNFEYAIELFLETFTPNFKECYEFIVLIAEPKSRQEFIQTYEINSKSLFASVTLGYDSKKIIKNLEFFNKFVKINKEIQDYIKRTTESYGKCRLVLKENTYFLESDYKTILEYYLSIKVLKDCWTERKIIKINENGFAEKQTNITSDTNGKLLNLESNTELYKKFEEVTLLSKKDQKEKKIIYRLYIKNEKLDVVRIQRDSKESRFKYMLNQEYSYCDETHKNLEITLKPSVKIRMYQEKALNRIFVKDRARSGIVVLPCGAGKTLVAILSICQIRKKTLVLCINNLNVKQWYKQILKFAKIDPKKIHKFVSDSKMEIPNLEEPCIVISTYTMISYRDEKRSAHSREFMDQIKKNDWGLLVLDEVQVAPAEVFKKAFLTKTRSHCKIGLTATLIREDNKIEDLQFYIGPKLYEESWIELTKQGFLAKVQCVEIRVPMAKLFMNEYLKKNEFGRNMAIYLYTANPNKFIVLQYLIEIHRARGDKILVFIDTIDILIEWARMLNYPYICGDLKNYEREKILMFFKLLKDDWNVIFISRVGDVGIDLPDANVAIEVSSLFGSRRQEAQRLGRILRPKEKKANETYQSYFYSLTSQGTKEMKYGFKRQKFLIKQGYNFKMIHETKLPYHEDKRKYNSYKLSSPESQERFLKKIMTMCLQKKNDRNFNNSSKMEITIKKNDLFDNSNKIYIEND